MSYVATSTEAFSGGTSRDIQAVTKKDLDELEKQLTEQLKDQLQKEREAQTELTEIPTGVLSVKSREFSAKEGDEVPSLSLKLTVTEDVFVYQSADLLPIAQKQLQEQLSMGTILRDERTTIKPNALGKNEQEQILLRTTLQSETIPLLDKQKVIDSIKNKTIEQAESFLREQPNIASFTVTVTPSLGRILFGRIPNTDDRIQVQTRVE
jgi:hypothetical protein